MNRILAADLYDFYEKSQWWDKSEILSYQRKMLSALIFHARDTTQFYKYRLNTLFLKRDQILWERWLEVPILQRTDVYKFSNNLLSQKIPAEHLPISTAKTSGSTGHPISVATTNFLRSALVATGWRAQKWYDINWSARLLTRDYSINPKLKSGDLIGTWGPPNERKSKNGRNFFFNQGNHADFLDLMNEKKPEYVSIYSGSIDILCELQAQRKESLKIDMFFSRGGEVTPELRENAKKIFNAEILEGYSTQECGSIAYACPTGSGFHINSESIYLEIIRDDGTEASLGEEGRVVVTPITSTAMPLIRYALGDRAVLGDRCECGRGLPLIKYISGREMHAFRHPDGRAFLGGAVGPLRPILNIKRWQVVQTGATDFEVRYISDRELEYEETTTFIDAFHKSIFDDAKIKFTKFEHLPLTESGKFIEYINQWEKQKQ